MRKPAKKKQGVFRPTSADLSLYNQKFERVVEPGLFRVMIGASSEDIRLKDEFRVNP
jgi:beta-glucosidase